MLAGPYCGLLLADLGAEVIKVESHEGDIARSIGGQTVGGHNVYFASLNRDKKSVALDLADPEERAEFDALVATADALVCNLRPRAIRKLGLTYKALAPINPKLVCVALTGYGLDGPLVDDPAYDYVIQALTGIMELTGDPDGPPTKAGYSAVDNSSGMAAALGLLAKIVEGKGGQVDVAMYDVMISQLNYLAAAWLNGGDRPRRHEGSSHPYIVPAQLFPTANHWLCIFITHDRFWKAFCQAIDRSEWIEDPAFRTMRARHENRQKVTAAIEEVLKTRTTEEWITRLKPTGIVVSQLLTLDRALSGEQVAARGLIRDIAVEGGVVRTVGNAIKWGDAAPSMPPPRLGEHNNMFRSDRVASLIERRRLGAHDE